MVWYQVVLLILGIVIFVISFIIPEKHSAFVNRKEEEKKFNDSVDAKVKEALSLLEERVDEHIEDAVSKAERSLERVSNEKIMAVNEYSDTVLGDIHKNHEEAVFLYSMLDDKYTNLKDTAVSVEQTTREAKDAVNQIKKVQADVLVTMETVHEREESFENTERTEDVPAAEDRTDEPDDLEEIVQALEQFAQGIPRDIPDKKEDKEKKSSATRNGNNKKKKQRNVPEVHSGDVFGNNNERILAMHKQGKSNVAIAKELGLGVGEVKLVIDLFR